MRRTLFVLWLLLLAPRVALAGDEPLDDAVVHYQRGLELLNRGAFPLALIELQRSYAIAPTPSLRYDIGRAELATGALADAFTSFERYLAEGGDDVPADRRAEVTRELAVLAGWTAFLTVTCSVDGAAIAIDGKVAGVAPLPRGRVETGIRRVMATKPGYAAGERSITLAAGDDAAIALTLEPLGPAATTVEPADERRPVPERPTRRKKLDVPVIAALSAAGAFVAGAAVTGGLAIGAVHRVDHDRETPIATTPQAAAADFEHDRRVARGFMQATDVLTAAAILAVGLAVYFHGIHGR